MSGLFITGTDTGVGKTIVTAAVTRALRAQGRRVEVAKPVASGISTDTELLRDAAGLPADQGHEQRITPWRFGAEAAPPVAARLEGKSLSFDAIRAAVERCRNPDGVLLVEGVGGLLCPLTDTTTVADLVAALALPLVVVARRSLGTLNHTLLTVEAAQRRGLDVVGVVVSETVPVADVAGRTNVEELTARLNVPILAVVPHTREVAVATAAVAGVNWEQLARRGACRT